jgi:hypothetical protein
MTKEALAKKTDPGLDAAMRLIAEARRKQNK